MSKNTEKSTADAQQENVFLNLALNIVLPAVILSQLSKEPGTGLLALGPLKALIVAISLPIGYGIYDFVTRKNFNFFSLLGFISVLLTGLLGLSKTGAFPFAVKEAIMPLLITVFILGSHLREKPFIRSIFLQPELINVKKLEGALAQQGAESAFKKLLFRCSLGLSATMVGSSVANFYLAMKILGGKEGGTTEFMEGIGKIHWMGFLIIGLPMLVAMIGIFVFMMKGLEKITGLDQDELTTPGKTVRRKVTKGEGADKPEGSGDDDGADTQDS